MITVRFLSFEFTMNNVSIDTLEIVVSKFTGLCNKDFYFLCNGKKLLDENPIPGHTIHVVLRTFGGKGGFGSMLRAIGAQIEKTTNREACRDLSGRRLRDINEEKRLKNWISQKEERERNAREKRRQKLERQCQEPKVELKDESFIKQRLELMENINESVEQGIKASSSGVNTKRKCEDIIVPKKKLKGIILDEDFNSEEDISSDDDNKSRENVKSELKVSVVIS